jgi:hypothetical protein
MAAAAILKMENQKIECRSGNFFRKRQTKTSFKNRLKLAPYLKIHDDGSHVPSCELEAAFIFQSG